MPTTQDGADQFPLLLLQSKDLTKQLIKNTVDNFPGTNLIVDLNEPNKPISVDAT
jgi:hypothetical protein